METPVQPEQHARGVREDAWASLEEIREVRRELAEDLGGLWIRRGQEALIRAGLACLNRDLAALDLPPHLRSRLCAHVLEHAIVIGRAPSNWHVGPGIVFPLGEQEFFGHRFMTNTYPWLRHVERAIAHLGAAEAQRVIAADLVPWALESGDPLRDRVEARQS